MHHASKKKKSDNRIRKTAGKEKFSGVGLENYGIEQMGQIRKGTFKKEWLKSLKSLDG